jgi:hypothetical protein
MQAGQVTSLSHWHVFQIQLDKLVNPGLSKEEMKAATTGTGMKKKKERKTRKRKRTLCRYVTAYLLLHLDNYIFVNSTLITMSATTSSGLHSLATLIKRYGHTCHPVKPTDIFVQSRSCSISFRGHCGLTFRP